MEVKDIKTLRQVVEDTLKIKYGENIKNIKLVRTQQLPTGAEKKEEWYALTECEDSENWYKVSMCVRMTDGIVISTEERERRRLSK